MTLNLNKVIGEFLISSKSNKRFHSLFSLSSHKVTLFLRSNRSSQKLVALLFSNSFQVNIKTKVTRDPYLGKYLFLFLSRQ